MTRYGVALDKKFSQELFGGLEFSRRDPDSPFVDNNVLLGTALLGKQDVQEDLSRVYLSWTPHPRLALRGENQSTSKAKA